MEDALESIATQAERESYLVLILVLMEDALETYPTPERLRKASIYCLNPCFNGRCPRDCSRHHHRIVVEGLVLILVLMEDALEIVGTN